MIRALFIALGITSLSMPAMAENIKGNQVVLRTLDKVTATTKDYNVKIGESLKYGSLDIDVKHCEKKPPEEIPETFAFLQIFENKSDDEIKADAELDEPQLVDGRAKLFSGWMLASKPAISALDHSVYDVWVIDCRQAVSYTHLTLPTTPYV